MLELYVGWQHTQHKGITVSDSVTGKLRNTASSEQLLCMNIWITDEQPEHTSDLQALFLEIKFFSVMKCLCFQPYTSIQTQCAADGPLMGCVHTTPIASS